MYVYLVAWYFVVSCKITGLVLSIYFTESTISQFSIMFIDYANNSKTKIRMTKFQSLLFAYKVVFCCLDFGISFFLLLKIIFQLIFISFKIY